MSGGKLTLSSPQEKLRFNVSLMFDIFERYFI